MGKFRLLPHSITSDVAFEATGRTPEELFSNAAMALFSVMCDVKRVEGRIKKEINLISMSLEELLYNFLNELIFLKDRDSMLFSKFIVAISDHRLQATIFGEKINPTKHKLGVDVKAVTKHNFSIKKEGGMYKATVVLDI